MNRYRFSADKKSMHPCFAKDNMMDKFYMDTVTGQLVVEKWIDEMPSEYRDIAADACVDAFENHVGRKMNGMTLKSFIDSVHDNLQKDQRISL